ncbi:zgc:103586 isoform X1 [Anguilla anguilla]|uniref:Uncharacterized protein n=1 Tax=Anguilla anguilla TaxID=7936 RepID=A0A9D3MRL3_ANGAN|nr:zgc:103586 isoform X1 [Anguilla anguilla]XP_035264783.1 zgc:103586 isoform X1 [Anguilla anguilla]KAG5852055.1 hypothetical protein ANANG_G00058370 [Anguilla anguilla]
MDLELAGLIALLFLSYVLPFTLGLTGALHLDECPQQPYIPIYLGVGGLLAVAAQLPYLKCCERRTDERPALRSLLKVYKALIFLVLFGWFITGSVWVYSIYPPNYDSSGTVYCAKTLYLVAFWFTNICYIFIAMGLAFGLYFYLKNGCDLNICSFFRSRSYTPLT